MKKAVIIIFLSSLIFTSCEKDYSGIVDPSINEFQVISVSPSGNVLFNAIDSLITIKINFTQTSTVGEVSCDIYSSDNNRLNSSRIILYDNGNLDFGDDVANDNSFANKFPLSSAYPIGNYTIRYYITINSGDFKQIAQSNFVYDNGQTNVAPVISDAVVDPDTVVVTGPTLIFCSVKADDPNGLNDIESTYFIVFRPDGTTSGSQTQLFDDGSSQNGDLIAGDGTFSRLIQVDQNNQKGLYRFEFRARDRGGLQSNIINYSVLIQ